ncbi:hypothetical protein Agub_g15172 [Astrephomene gubernaculifera]|uniref:non-specific serine/threonine protein kinase n=1 Tax=Astrephomene gubernaculifera TaxID=47775 RepID=A0AAD3HSV4_9CHLO|nr:hypothetical protein Agub_g15172 [Astrephomene gubernaculifera]
MTSAGKKLSDRFLIGEELGRGAYGQVYKGIDYTNGDTVAIKQISLAGIPSDNLQSVMGEIDLLKTLNHKNIVKYIGSFKTRSHLYIILEFMENGSLASIIKPTKFGTFPESLVALYIAQVLQGLQYLHEQGVVHRDIKGANILTTKDGLVKLADFGVAAKLGEVEERRDVVGTPYWMAPEVIEMTQVTSSSDIWSVGCLIVELLTGYPPYFDLNACSAMFRIVQDAMPPLPEDISPLLRDFLSRCFLKDAKLRPDARTLLQHEWLQHNRRTLRMSWRRDQGLAIRTLVKTRAAKQSADAHETINSVLARMAAVDNEEDSTGRTAADSSAHAAMAEGPLGSGARPAPGDGFREGAGGAAGGSAGAEQVVSGEDVRVALIPEGTAQSSAPQYSSSSHPAAGGGVVGSTLPYMPVAGASQQQQSQQQQQQQQQPMLLGQQSLQASNVMPAGVLAPQTSGAADGMPPLSMTTSPVALAQMAMSGVDPGQQQALLAAAGQPPSGLSNLIQRLQRDDALLYQQQQQQPALISDGGSAGFGGRPTVRNLAAWTEGGGQSYDALRIPSRHLAGAHGYGYLPGEGGLFFDGAMYGVLEAESMGSTFTTQATELRRTVRDLVRNLRPGTRQDAAATSSARAASTLEQMIAPPTTSTTAAQQQQPQSQRQPGAGGTAAGEQAPAEGSGAAAPPQYAPAEVKSLFLSEGGVLVLMELLDTDSQKAVEAALDLLSALVRDDVRLLESLCLVGVVPAVARFTQQPWPAGLRLKAAAFVHSLCFQRDSTLQLFIAAGGLKQLCSMVADSVASEPSPLSHVAIQCLLQVLQCYATLPLNYICRILAHCGLVPRLYKLLKEVIVARRRMAPQHQAAAQAAAAAATKAPAPAAAGGAGNGAAAGGGSGALHGRSVSSAAVLSGNGSPPQANGVHDGAAAAAGGGGGAATQAAEAAGGGSSSRPHRAMSLPAGGAATGGAVTAGSIPGATLTYDQVTYLLDKSVYLLVVLSNADGAVKAAMCSHENLLQHLDCLVRLQPPHLVELLRCLRNLTSDPSVLPAIKDSGAIACLVPMLGAPATGVAAASSTVAAVFNPGGAAGGAAGGGAAGAASAAAGPNPLNTAVVLPKSEVQMEALNALYNLCMFNKKVHLEAAASAGIIPHLCSFAAQACAAVAATRSQRQASSGSAQAPSTAASSTPAQPAAAVDVSGMTPGSPAAIQAAAAQWPTVRGFVVPLLLGMVVCSSATRNKLYGNHGLDIFLHLLSDEDSRSVLGVLQAVDSWLAEDHSRVEVRITQRDAVAHLVQLYARSCAAQDMQSKLEALRTMLGRSSKLAVALAMGGLVPWLLAMIQHAAPINRVKILDIVRILYEHYPRPKEFILMYKIQDVLAMLVRTHGRDADAVIQQAQRLLSAFDINVLL